MTVLKEVLGTVDGVKDLEDVEMKSASENSKMLSFKYRDVIFTSLYLGNDDDSTVGINYRTSFSRKMNTKKTKVQILNDLNKFNHGYLGIKVVLLSIKEKEIKLSFDVEKWTFNKFINNEIVKADLEFMIFCISVFGEEHKYMG